MIRLSARNYSREQIAHIERELPISAGMVKLVCGMSNSLAFLVMGNARDKMRSWKKYKFKTKKEFERCFELYRQYEQHLLCPPEGAIRFFHVADVTGEFKDKLRDDLTDAEYLEFWTSISGPLYEKVWPFVTCLAHKFYRTLKMREVKDAEFLQWPLAAMAILELASGIYRNILKVHERDFKIPLFVLEEVFEPFNIANITKQWERAIATVFNFHYELKPIEQRNIELTLRQLEKIVTEQDLLLKSVQGTIESFGTEIFKSKGVVKKSIRDIDNIIEEVHNEQQQ